uniref:(northern house mosquito) hypothetical protein n=1 Tax=Culex pipiens TaxID=7175 RepID=A0A8D8HFQ6_CULPI
MVEKIFSGIPVNVHLIARLAIRLVNPTGFRRLNHIVQRLNLTNRLLQRPTVGHEIPANKSSLLVKLDHPSNRPLCLLQRFKTVKVLFIIVLPLSRIALDRHLLLLFWRLLRLLLQAGLVE